MEYIYVICPVAAWLIASSLKFIINSLRAGRLAFGLIGYGGLPSNHSAIVSSTTALIALQEGVYHPAFGVALTLSFIIILDASSLRKHVGKQAAAINHLADKAGVKTSLRERIGHTPVEIFAGVVVGVSTALWLTTLR